MYDTATKTPEEKLAQVNPNYSKGGEWHVNCQRCVVAYELIQRGYDVTAKPRDENDPINSSGVAAWKINSSTGYWRDDPEFEFGKTRGKFKKTIEDAFAKWGDGARAIVRVGWMKKHGGGGHVFNAVRKGNEIIYIDPQTNKRRNLEETLKRCTTAKNELWVMRVDNRELSDNVKYAVQNRGDSNDKQV